MPIKLVAFDWNGTILSDARLVFKAQNGVLNHFGHQLIDFKKFQDTYAIPVVNIWTALGFNKDFFAKHSDEIQKKFMSGYEPGESTCRMRLGAREILEWLEQNNIQAVIFSNHPTEHIRAQLQKRNMSQFFLEVLGRDPNNAHMHVRGKGAKLNIFVNSLKLRPEEVLTVGDTDEEIEIGKEYGFHTAALTDGYQSVARLKAAQPNFIISNLKQLKEIIKNL